MRKLVQICFGVLKHPNSVSITSGITCLCWCEEDGIYEPSLILKRYLSYDDSIGIEIVGKYDEKSKQY